MNAPTLTTAQIIALFHISHALDLSWVYRLDFVLYGYDEAGVIEFMTQGTYEDWDVGLQILPEDDIEDDLPPLPLSQEILMPLRYGVWQLVAYLNDLLWDEPAYPATLTTSVADVIYALNNMQDGIIVFPYKNIEVRIAPDYTAFDCRNLSGQIWLSVKVEASSILADVNPALSRSADVRWDNTFTTDEVWEVYPLLTSLIGERAAFFQMARVAVEVS